MRIQRADLSGNLFALDGRFDSSAIGVSHHNNHLRAQHKGAIFETRYDFRGDDISCNSRNKYMTDTLIEDEFNGDSRIRAGQYSGEWLLFFGRVLFKNREIMLVSGQAARGESFVAIHQFSQSRVRAKRTLREH